MPSDQIRACASGIGRRLSQDRLDVCLVLID